MLPFTRDEFFAVFAAYNERVWPAQLLLCLLAVGIVGQAIRGRRPALPPSIALGLLWLWTGLAYHLRHFTAINRAAWLFGILFLVQGALFLGDGWSPRRRLVVSPPSGARRWTGGALIVYALVLYPLLGLAAGTPLRELPVLGVPCPTTIFTLGLLFWTPRPVPRHLLVVPLLWAFVGSSAFFLLGVPQDAGLLVAGLAGLWLLRRAPRR